jgi:hypothetical protein
MIFVPCNPLLHGWHLAISWTTYLFLFCLPLVVVLRALHSLFRALAVQKGDFPYRKDRDFTVITNFCKAFWACFKGFGSYKEHNDLLLPAFIGWIELAAYPVLIALGQFVVIGGWIGIKTAGAWMGWKASRTSFNRFLLFNLLSLLLSYFWLSHYVDLTPCPATITATNSPSGTDESIQPRKEPSTPNQQSCPIVATNVVIEAPLETAPTNAGLSFWRRLGAADSPTLNAAASVIGAIVAGVIGLIAYRFNRNSQRGQAAHNQIAMLLGIDGHLIDKPELWWIWDDADRPGPVTDKPLEPDEVSKRKAILAAYFNMFEVVYEFYFHTIWCRTKDDERKWEAWDRYITHFFANSKEARELFPTWAQLYSEDFANKMNEFIKSPASRKLTD